jgi:hypothetical protein
MKIIVCGDSFYSDDSLYPGIHWTQQLLKFNPSLEIENLSVCGASNLLIHAQIDRAISSKPDYIIVNFTTSTRATIKYTDNKILPDLLDRFYKINSEQNNNTDLISFPYSGIDIFEEINKKQNTLLKQYFLDCVDLDLARLESYCMINSALNSLLDSNIKFLYCRGGFDHKKFLKPGDIRYDFLKFINFEIPINLWDYWTGSRDVHPYFHVLDEKIHYTLAKYCLTKITQ